MDINKLYKPQKEFKERTKHLFLSAYSAKYPASRTGVSPAFRYFVRGLATGAAAIVLLGGAGAYANQKNVGPESVLYPLKRSHETVNLALSSSDDKPILHLKFATRRLEEIQVLKSSDPQSNKVAELVSDFEKEIVQSLPTIPNGDIASAASPGTDNELGSENESFEEVEMGGIAPAAGAVPGIAPRTMTRNQDLPSAISTSVPSAPEAVFRGSSKQEKSGGSKHSGSGKEEKDLRICKSWALLLQAMDPGIQQVLQAQEGNILKRYSKKCVFSEAEDMQDRSGKENDDRKDNNKGKQDQIIPKVEEIKDIQKIHE